MADLLAWFSDPKRRRPLLRLLVGGQVLYVLGVAGAGYATTALGKQVVLATAPPDPKDLLAGDFVRLRYANKKKGGKEMNKRDLHNEQYMSTNL